ncbi:MAG: hypothetical protein KGJ23_13975 [Euryarchaeota archaeon]|nr:hypothetical protein [Euryarchaeota archaeon]MDE1837706.1 hypothetical protein [Euryarchaeota archaeon]MDE1881735.1 hypothetical protein [Euryarchaeota archaeon]MDE2045964.1 hypothetical protein [Thermoplasmata archaeon]
MESQGTPLHQDQPSGPLSPTRAAGKRKTRSPGKWSTSAATSSKLAPEADATIPWIPPASFVSASRRAMEDLGYTPVEIPKRPDAALGERNLSLDEGSTRQQMVRGIVLFAVCLGSTALILIPSVFWAIVLSAAPLLFVLPIAIGLGLGLGTTLSMRSLWQSEVLRIRLDPASTRLGKALSPSMGAGNLHLRIFVGTVRSRTTGSKTGTWRSVWKTVPSPSSAPGASRVLSALTQAVGAEPNVGESSPKVLPSLTSPVEGRKRRSATPANAGTTWKQYPSWFRVVGILTLLLVVLSLTLGALSFNPWRVSNLAVEPGGPGVLNSRPVPWSPFGPPVAYITWGAWVTSTNTAITGISMDLALCPSGTSTLVPAQCRPAMSGSFTVQDAGNVTVTMPNGWHVLFIVNSSQLCGGCYAWAGFEVPLVFQGALLLGVGTVSVITMLATWLYLRPAASRAWPLP